MTSLQLDAQYELLSSALSGYANIQTRPLVDRIFDAGGYAIDRIFDDPTNGFQALGLKSKDGSKPPVLVLPGGNVGNPGGPGGIEFAANKQAIKNWLVNITNDKTANPQGIKPDVIGSSRGGALAQLTAIEFPTLIGAVVSFISTGVDRQAADKFIQNGGDPSQVRHYVNNGDYRSLLGEAFIPGKVTVSTFDTPLLTGFVSGENIDYATRKHNASILADLSAVFPDSSRTAFSRSLGNIPVDRVLSEISVDELNRPDFTWNGRDWQAGQNQVRQNNPNLAFLGDRQGLEEARTSGIDFVKLTFEAIQGVNTVAANQVNVATAKDDILLATDFGTIIDDAAAGTSTASIVYNTTNGSLYYNANGAAPGFGDGGLFASVFDRPAVTAESFTLI